MITKRKGSSFLATRLYKIMIKKVAFMLHPSSNMSLFFETKSLLAFAQVCRHFYVDFRLQLLVLLRLTGTYSPISMTMLERVREVTVILPQAILKSSLFSKLYVAHFISSRVSSCEVIRIAKFKAEKLQISTHGISKI